MKRKFYISPKTEFFRVELEDTFAGSVVQGDKSGVTSTGQEINEINASDEAYGWTVDGAWNDGKQWK